MVFCSKYHPLKPAGGHLGDGDGAIFFFFFAGGFLVGVAFFVAVAVGVAFTVGVEVEVGDSVAAHDWLGTSAKESTRSAAIRFIDHSI